MPQPNKGSAGTAHVSQPYLDKAEDHGAKTPNSTAGVKEPVGIIKGVKGTGKSF